jgi:hypothetical protein
MSDMISSEAPEHTRGLSVEEIRLYAQSVVDTWEGHFRDTLSRLSPDMLRVIANWCTTQADSLEPPPVLGSATYGWEKQKTITRTLAQLPAANMARVLDARGYDVPAICDEMAKNSMARGDGRVTWETRAIARLIERERGRRFIWDVPRVEGRAS